MTARRAIVLALLAAVAAAAPACLNLPHYGGAESSGRGTRHERRVTEPVPKRRGGGDIELTKLAHALGVRLRPSHGLPIAELVRDEIVDECRAGAEPHDLVLAIDTTGSMGGYITELRALGGALGDAVKAGCRIGLIDYRDKGDAWEVRTVDELGTAPEIVSRSLLELGWDGGGDWPEALLSALDVATAKIDADALLGRVIVVTDAPSHEDERAEERVKRRLAAGRIAITIVAVSGDFDPIEEVPRTGTARAVDDAVAGAAAGRGAAPAPAPPPGAKAPATLLAALRGAGIELREAASPVAASVAVRTWLALVAVGRAPTLDVALVVDETVPGLAEALAPRRATEPGRVDPALVAAAATGPAALPALLERLRGAGARAAVIGAKAPERGDEWHIVAPLGAATDSPGAGTGAGASGGAAAPPDDSAGPALWSVLAHAATLPWTPGRTPVCVLLTHGTGAAPAAEPAAEKIVRTWIAGGARVLVVTTETW